MTSQLTILITPRFPPESCGVGDYVFRLAQNLQARGEEVRVLARPAGVARPSGVAVLELPMRGWRDLGVTLRAILAARPARVQLEYSPYGWSRCGFSFWLNALALRLRIAGVPFLVAFHEVPLNFLPRPDLAALAVIQRIHAWLLATTAASVLSNTPERIRILRRWLPWRRGKIFYRPNAATIPVQPISGEQRAALRLERSVADGALVICTFGMFQSGKNYEGLIESIALARRAADLRLWLLGDLRATGEQRRQKLQAAVAACNLQEVAWWSGHMEPAAISAHLQVADIFVLPQADGHLTRSSAFMAAAAHGMAVIAVRNDENQREFTHGENVWLVERSDAQHFADAVAKLAGDPELRSRLGNNLRSLYAKNFDWPKSGATALETPLSARAALAGETVQR